MSLSSGSAYTAYTGSHLAAVPSGSHGATIDDNDTTIGNEGRASLYEMLLLSQLSGIRDQGSHSQNQKADVPLAAA